MPSDEEFRELKDQVASLSSALATARRRIDDLEDGMADHLGLDWGESLVDTNSPHPNMSVNTIESGGGTIRQDANGMQVRGNSLTAAIYFVETFVSDPDTATAKGVVSGFGSESTQEGGLELRAYTTYADVSYAALSVANDNYWVAGSGAGQAGFALYEGSGGNRGKLDLGYTGSLLQLAWLPADPSNNVDGTMWYRYDTDKFTVRINSATENLATESYVTTAVAAPASTWALTADISPSQITADQNDYSPTSLSTASVLRLNSDAARNITGLAGGSDGRVLLIFNVGSFNIVLKDESASSTAANRFALNGDITLQPDNSVGLWYDSTSSRWRAF